MKAYQDGLTAHGKADIWAVKSSALTLDRSSDKPVKNYYLPPKNTKLHKLNICN